MKLPTPRQLSFAISAMLLPFISSAQSVESKTSYFSNPLFLALLVVIIILLALIAVVAGVLKNIGNSDVLLELMREDKSNQIDAKSNSTKVSVILFILFVSTQEAMAQTQASASGRVGGIDPLTFYTLIGIIVAEIIVLFSLIGVVRRLLKPSFTMIEKTTTPEVQEPQKTLMDKLNASIEIEREAEIMMDHDYDGIKELDNNLPPWWKYGFYLTIVFAVAYLLHYHVMRTGDLQEAEYNKAVAQADAEVAEYLKNSANNVDESSVKYLDQATDIESGKQIYTSLCVTCHGKSAEGGIGPNLTDNYWLHKGGIVDIFKSVKYGWPEKGMKSWKEDLSPMQIAQVSSYIYSLKGSNPPNPKKPEGDIYIDPGQAPLSDSLKSSVDTLALSSVQLPADTSNKK